MKTLIEADLEKQIAKHTEIIVDTVDEIKNNRAGVWQFPSSHFSLCDINQLAQRITASYEAIQEHELTLEKVKTALVQNKNGIGQCEL